jgi:hypothetical protein
MTIKVHQAEVNTATVEIKTITINGKQVTLATFRQLYDESLIDHEGNFRGVPWGRVHYHPDKSCKDTEHEHVVWQQGDELRRSNVRLPEFGLFHPDSDVALIVVADGTLRDAQHENRVAWGKPAWIQGHKLFRDELSTGQWFTLGSTEDHPRRGEIQIAAPENDELRAAGFSYGYGVDPDAHNRALLCRDDVVSELTAEVDQEVARRQRHRDRWAEIHALPQLFIAT